MDRRTTERFPLNLPMTVRWTTRSGITETQTESEDVSSGGIYFYLSERIKDGLEVEIVLTLPHEVTLAGRARVQCHGRVRRSEVMLNRVGVAAQIDSYQFLHERQNDHSLSVVKA